MSRRSDRGRAAGERGDRAAPSDRAASGEPVARGPGPAWGLPLQVAFLAAVFALVVLVAELAGAANLGVALGIGQIAFAIAVVYLLMRR
jgi:hypothetical protein